MHLVGSRKIWDSAPHNAFTDLIRFRNSWFCVFREGATHVSPDGAARVLVSSDGLNWSSEALLGSPTGEVRDPKLSVTPQGELMISAGIALHAPVGGRTHQTVAWLAPRGEEHTISLYHLWRLALAGRVAGWSCIWRCVHAKPFRLCVSVSEYGRTFFSEAGGSTLH